MAEPIPVKVTRYRCPHCARTASSKARTRQHMARCWLNPDVKGCKTCKHFDRDWDGYGVDLCLAGVDLSGRPGCEHCVFGALVNIDEVCPECNGEPEGVKPGPIVGCEKWEAS